MDFEPTPTALDVDRISANGNAREAWGHVTILGLPVLKLGQDEDAILREIVMQMVDALKIRILTADLSVRDTETVVDIRFTITRASRRLDELMGGMHALTRLWVVRNPDRFVE